MEWKIAEGILIAAAVFCGVIAGFHFVCLIGSLIWDRMSADLKEETAIVAAKLFVSVILIGLFLVADTFYLHILHWH